MSRRGFLVTSLAVAATIACGANVSRGIRREWVGTQYARLTGYFAYNEYQEQTPGAIPHDALRDEATLAVLAADGACIDVVVRTDSSVDEPFDQLSPECTADGHPLPVLVQSELVSVYDYAYAGSRSVLQAEGIVGNAFAALDISAPSAEVLRVIQRTGRLCCPAQPQRRIALELTNPRMSLNSASYGIEFEWELAP